MGLLKVSHKMEVKVLDGAAVIGRRDWDWRVWPPQSCLVPHNMAPGFSEASEPREDDGSSNVFYDLSMEVGSSHGKILIQHGRRLQGHEYQEAGITEGHLGGWFPHGTSGSIRKGN